MSDQDPQKPSPNRGEPFPVDTKVDPLSPEEPGKSASRLPWIVGLILVGLVIWGVTQFWGGGDMVQFVLGKDKPPSAGEKAAPGQDAKALTPPPPSANGPVVTLGSGQTPSSPDPEQAQRKKSLGVHKSLDAVVRSDEAVKLGRHSVSIKDLQRKLMVQGRGKMMETVLGKEGDVSVWGVHVVRPGENLWDIHFRLLKEYMARRGVELKPHADRPTAKGYSSGVGKVLKFAEHMVGVYNTETGMMSSNLNQLEPGRKVVVYNLTEIFRELDKIDPKRLSSVMYDGRVLYFPEETTQTQGEKKELQ